MLNSHSIIKREEGSLIVPEEKFIYTENFRYLISRCIKFYGVILRRAINLICPTLVSVGRTRAHRKMCMEWRTQATEAGTQYTQHTQHTHTQ